MKGRRLNLLLLALSLFAIAATTLPPTWGYSRGVGLFCLGCGPAGLTDVVLNVLLFAPLGFALGRLGMRPLLALGLGLALSGGIEGMQFIIPGRAPTVRDVLTNGIGCGIGALIGVHLLAWVTPGRRATGWFWSAIAAFLLSIGLTGELLHFDAPPGIYYGQWAPERGSIVPWKGRLDAVRVDTFAVRDGPSLHSERIRAVLEDSLRVRITGVAGPPTRRLGGIIALVTDADEQAFLLGTRNTDVVVQVHRRAESWRMKAPEYRFTGAMRGVPDGTPLELSVTGTSHRLCLSVNGVTECAPRAAAGSTWTMARPFDWAPQWFRRSLDAITVAILFFPAALLVRSVPRPHALAGGAVFAIGFPVIAWTSGLALPGLAEWLGVAVALAAGLLINARLRTPPPPAAPTPPGSTPRPAA